MQLRALQTLPLQVLTLSARMQALWGKWSVFISFTVVYPMNSAVVGSHFFLY